MFGLSYGKIMIQKPVRKKHVSLVYIVKKRVSKKFFAKTNAILPSSNED